MYFSNTKVIVLFILGIFGESKFESAKGKLSDWWAVVDFKMHRSGRAECICDPLNGRKMRIYRQHWLSFKLQWLSMFLWSHKSKTLNMKPLTDSLSRDINLFLTISGQHQNVWQPHLALGFWFAHPWCEHLSWFFRLMGQRPMASSRRGASLPLRKVSLAAKLRLSPSDLFTVSLPACYRALITSSPAGGVFSLPPTKPYASCHMDAPAAFRDRTKHTHTHTDSHTHTKGCSYVTWRLTGAEEHVLRKFQRKWLRGRGWLTALVRTLQHLYYWRLFYFMQDSS